MSSTFAYRLHSSCSLGGLAADLTAEHRLLEANTGAGPGGGNGLRIHRNVWLTLPCGTHWRDAAWLSFGLSAHSADLASAHPDGLVVKVTALAYPLAHFRSEVAALDWRRFERQAGVAVHVHPDGLAAILASVLASRAHGVNVEDLVDMLGELRAPEGVEPIASPVQERKDADGPFFTLCVKGGQALGEIGTPKALRFLEKIAKSAPGEWPNPLKWHAAEELGIEDELGFDEDTMLGEA